MLICGGLYINHQLNILSAALANSELFLSLMPEDDSLLPEDILETPGLPETAPGGDGVTIDIPGAGHDIGSVLDKPAQPPAKKDLIKAGLIILRKFNREEIDFLYQIAAQGSCTPEELQSVRKIILETLTPQEIDTLRELGAKYGKELRFLDSEVELQ